MWCLSHWCKVETSLRTREVCATFHQCHPSLGNVPRFTPATQPEIAKDLGGAGAGIGGALGRDGDVTNEIDDAVLIITTKLNGPCGLMEVGKSVHRVIEREAVKTGRYLAEVQIGRARADLVNILTRKPVEIKPGTPTGLSKGAEQLPKYGDGGSILPYPAPWNPASWRGPDLPGLIDLLP